MAAAGAGDGRELSLPALGLGGWDGAVTRLSTDVRLAVLGDRLTALFHCRHDRLAVNPSLPRDRGVWGLWERDVVELFVSAGPDGVPYREVEASAAGQWLALAFDGVRRPAKEPWRPAVRVGARVAGPRHTIEISLPLASLGLDAGAGPWRLGLFRIHGSPGAREYQSLHPTGTAIPDFHRPESWALLAPPV